MSGRIYGDLTNDGNDPNLAIFDPVVMDGWSNGHTVVTAPNYDDFHLIRWYDGYINMKQLRIPTGFVYHKITIPAYGEIEHETCRLSNDSFVTGDDNRDEDGFTSDWTTTLKEDGVGYIYSVSDAYYLCLTVDAPDFTRSYNSQLDDNFNYGVLYKTKYTLFIKLDANSSTFVNYPLNNHYVSKMTVYYKYNVVNPSTGNTLTRNGSEESEAVQLEEWETDYFNAKHYHIIKTIQVIKDFENNVYDIVMNQTKTYGHRYELTFGENLSTYLANNRLKCCGYATIKKYIANSSYGNYNRLSVLKDNEIEYYNLSGIISQASYEAPEYRVKFDSYSDLNDINSELIPTTPLNTDDFVYEGCFAQHDIDSEPPVLHTEDEVAKTTFLTEVEHISSAIMYYRIYNDTTVNHDVYDLSDTSQRKLITILKNLNQTDYDVHDERDILFGQYASYRNGSGNDVSVIDSDMFKVKNAKILIKK